MPARREVSGRITASEMSAYARGVANWVVGGQYSGARYDRTSLKTFTPAAGSADTDSISDLATLRARSRDLVRNDGIAKGARNTSRVNVVGSGLRLRPQVQRELLGLSEKEAEAWQDKVEVLFHLWASSKCADATYGQNFYEMQGTAFNGAFESGDCFAVRRYREDEKDKEAFLGLCLQLVESDRVNTPSDRLAIEDVRDGVVVDPQGAAKGYWFQKAHPAEGFGVGLTSSDYDYLPARGEYGHGLIVHLFDRDRIGLSRGIPALAPVIEDLKQLCRYSDAELMAAVVSAFFTVFIKTDNGGSDIVGEEAPDGVEFATNQVGLGAGSVVELSKGESIETANPNRPNANFDKFFLAMLRKIGVALGIPLEVLIMHFEASYSASRAALEIAWQFFSDRRTWLARNFCQPVYQWFLYEAVALGLVKAPGFLDDPLRRAAWSVAQWIGPARIVIDPTKEATAAEKWMDLGVKTGDEVTLEITGGDYWANLAKRVSETEFRATTKLDIRPAVPAVPKPAAGPKQPNDGGA